MREGRFQPRVEPANRAVEVKLPAVDGLTPDEAKAVYNGDFSAVLARVKAAESAQERDALIMRIDTGFSDALKGLDSSLGMVQQADQEEREAELWQVGDNIQRFTDELRAMFTGPEEQA